MATGNQSLQAVSSTATYYDLGDFSYPITKQSQDAQILSNRGLVWAYCFNHMEAACFDQVIAHDPDYTIGY